MNQLYSIQPEPQPNGVSNLLKIVSYTYITRLVTKYAFHLVTVYITNCNPEPVFLAFILEEMWLKQSFKSTTKPKLPSHVSNLSSQRNILNFYSNHFQWERRGVFILGAWSERREHNKYTKTCTNYIYHVAKVQWHPTNTIITSHIFSGTSDGQCLSTRLRCWIPATNLPSVRQTRCMYKVASVYP